MAQARRHRVGGDDITFVRAIVVAGGGVGLLPSFNSAGEDPAGEGDRFPRLLRGGVRDEASPNSSLTFVTPMNVISNRMTPATEALMTNRHYHGTRTELKLRDLIVPAARSAFSDRDPASTRVLLTPNLDEAIWSAELADSDVPPRVYVVQPLGPIARVSQEPDCQPPGHPAMSWCSREPLRVTGEVTEWFHYHGTRADLQPDDLIKPGYVSNFGATVRTANYVYFTRTLDAAAWGAELAVGEGRGRIYIVAPTGPIEDDPNLTNKRFRGNPTKSFRSREPLRITGEIADWQGHTPGAIQAMRDGLERLRQLGVDAIDD